jgi:diguanylate cyclase (GGDEF)-like protein/PAS domain S-box-containing protein
MTAGDQLRVLMVEAVPESTEMIASELRRGGLDPTWRRVDTAEGLAHELETFRPRIVLFDQAMPSFDGMSALEVCRERAPETPFLVVTGSTSMENAVEGMKPEVAHWVVKGHLQRLVPAVEEALQMQEMRAANECAEKQLRLQGTAMEAAANGIMITDHDGVIEWANPAFTAMTGYPLEELVGRNPRFLGSGANRRGIYRTLWKTILAGGVWHGEIENRRKDGTTYTEEISIAPVRMQGGPVSHFVAVTQDISARKKEREEIQRLGTVDPLTRMLNRASFSVRLDAAVGYTHGGRPGALILLDLDRFHVVNEMEGRPAGDLLLVLLAERLATAIRPVDVLARLDGGEFAVILTDVDPTAALETAEVLREVVGRFRFTVGERAYDLTASAGIVEIDGTAPTELLLARADEALHDAKECGRNQTVAWGADLEGRTPTSEARRWAAKVKDAFRDDRLVIHFQPVVSLDDGRTLHHEALVRLLAKDGEIVLPGAFLSAATRFGLMPRIDQQVVEKSLEVLQRRPDVNLFVNLSGESLTDEAFLAWIETAIAGCGLAPGRLTFEITETTAVSDLLRVKRGIRSLRGLGCGFAIDDFGTGFSSFGYLRALPVDHVKIDGSYVRDIDRNPTTRALVSAMVSVAHALGKTVVAEMVDRESVAVVLRELGVEYGQGWRWGRAGPEPIPGDI